MTDLSGIESNKVSRSAIVPGAPYYYINASLDISLLAVEAGSSVTLYFNKDNNYDYLDTILGQTYTGFYPLEDNSVIGEVVVYSNPDVVPAVSGMLFNVGGAASLTTPVIDTWGGKTGYSAGLLDADDINSGSICYYGHEGANFSLAEGKFLAVTISRPAALLSQSELQARAKSKKSLRKGRAVRQVVDPAVTSGVIHVVVKVYPKFQ